MRTIDYYYRAFVEYKKVALKDKGIQDFLRQINSLGTSKISKLSIERVKCEVSEDWISEIENNLKYIEKAISQERQFIRTNGEVVLIEKTKSVSKESISHLAKHASLIKEIDEETDEITLGDSYGDWMASSDELHNELDKVLDMVGGQKDE